VLDLLKYVHNKQSSTVEAVQIYLNYEHNLLSYIFSALRSVVNCSKSCAVSCCSSYSNFVFLCNSSLCLHRSSPFQWNQYVVSVDDGEACWRDGHWTEKNDV